MRRRTLFLFPVGLLSTGLLALAGCGGGGEDPVAHGNLTNPNNVPTASPWDQPPAVVELDPDAIQPLPPQAGAPTPTPSAAAGAPGVCGPKYTIASGDTFSSIAEKCGTTTQAMRDANPGVDPLTIRPGQEVNVPAAAPAPSP